MEVIGGDNSHVLRTISLEQPRRLKVSVAAFSAAAEPETRAIPRKAANKLARMRRASESVSSCLTGRHVALPCRAPRGSGGEARRKCADIPRAELELTCDVRIVR